ncbi:RcnB family protein [Phenylobacterium parvum]|uniref:ATP-dependent RNA helicase n=1 Tax=Phenylobacterium parvum TaxID=2201350 RepID=A0A2Z3HZD0_9CAUL|nr:RcnB family protein [Phenylobacterium parvum]AWM76928.1 hypothetical protein HYN04_03660 [Phenylobacterium parvum]
MNRHSASASLLTLILALGLVGASSALAQEAGEGEGRPDRREDFQPPREDGPRLDRREAPAPPFAPPPSARPEPRPEPRPDSGAPPQAWGRYGQPREARPDPAPGGGGDRPGRESGGRDGDRREGGDRGRHDDRRYDGSRHDGYRYDGYRPDGYRPDGYRPDGYRPDGYRYDYRPDGRRYDGYRHDGRRPPRYDPRWYPPVWIPPYRYRGDPWSPPPGFSYRRWSYGEVLPWTWWTPRYRIDSWWVYGLPVPPVGFAWVRLGRDAVMVDLWTGRIVQVAFSLFW